MIYLDNAATSFPKPPGVLNALRDFAENCGANPGRGGYRLSLAAERAVSAARAKLAKLLNAPDASRVVFTLNGTDALNIALKGFLRTGDNVVTSSVEHNSVSRPLNVLEREGRITVTRISPGPDLRLSAESLAAACTEKTKLVAVTAASNVLGALNDIGALSGAAHKAGAAILVDAAQAVGITRVDVASGGIDIMAFPCHKALFGPMGTGALYVREGLELRPFREGGTGLDSENDFHPDAMPMRLEGGTPNAHGLAGLSAAIDFIEQTGVSSIHAHDTLLADMFAAKIAASPEVVVLNGARHDTGIVSFRIKKMPSQDVAALLDSNYDIAVRAGLHCSPGAHRFLGTSADGAVRVSFGLFNTEEESEKASSAVLAIAASDKI